MSSSTNYLCILRVSLVGLVIATRTEADMERGGKGRNAFYE